MYKRCYSCIFCLLLLSACGNKDSLSPVVLKVDSEYGHSSIGNYSENDYEPSVHKVANNQTLFDVAYIYNIDPANLAKINNISLPYRVKNGQSLKLPSSDRGYSAVPTEKMCRSIKVDLGESLDSEVVARAFETPKAPTVEKVTKKIAPIKTAERDRLDEQFERSFSAKEVEKKKNQDAGAFFPVIPTFSTVEDKKISTKKEAPVKSDALEIDSTFMMPVDGKIISKFGDTMKDDFVNEGMNIETFESVPVRAAAAGTVFYVGDELKEEYGKIVIIQHNNELVTSYAHLDKITVKKGEAIKKGQQIGLTGKTGNVENIQLYFEVLENNTPVNPKKFL